MKKLAVFSIALLLAIPLTSMIVSAADGDATLSGEPVDITCFLTGKSGEGHASCAMACANKGLPIGFLVKDGDKSELYLVLGGDGKSAKDLMAAHMGKQVKATGSVATNNGLKVFTVTKVEVSS